MMLLKRLVTWLTAAAVTEAATAYNKTLLNAASKSAIKRLTSMDNWYKGWDWDHGIGLYGIWKHYQATNDISSFDEVQAWLLKRFVQGQKKHVNSMAVISTLVDYYEESGEPEWLPYIEEWGSWAMYNLTRTEDGGMQHVISNNENKGQLWIDTLMMAALPLAKIGIKLNKPEYVAEAKKQFDIHIKYLFDEKADLFYHGWTFVNKNNFGAIHWARGNSWALITLTEIMDLLGGTQDPAWRKTLDIVQEKLVSLQDKQNDNLWRTVLDRPIDEGSYIETSASAGFVFSYLKGQRKGWIAKDKFTDTVETGINGVLGKIASSGEVKNVSAGTGMGKDAQHYYNIPRRQTMWGQGMAIMALMEAYQS